MHHHTHAFNIAPPSQPTEQHIEVLYLHAYRQDSCWDHHLNYIQHVRERKVYVYDYLRDDLRAQMRSQEQTYYARLQQTCIHFANALHTENIPIDLVVDPPSNTHLHRPYLTAVRDRFPGIDSLCFVKEGSVSSSDQDRTVNQLAAFMRPRCSRDVEQRLPAKRFILIVDDAFATGETAAAIIQHLSQRITNEETRFFLACPLLISQ